MLVGVGWFFGSVVFGIFIGSIWIVMVVLIIVIMRVLMLIRSSFMFKNFIWLVV